MITLVQAISALDELDSAVEWEPCVGMELRVRHSRPWHAPDFECSLLDEYNPVM